MAFFVLFPTSVHLLLCVSGLKVLVNLGDVLHHALPVWPVCVHHLTELLHRTNCQDLVKHHHCITWSSEQLWLLNTATSTPEHLKATYNIEAQRSNLLAYCNCKTHAKEQTRVKRPYVVYILKRPLPSVIKD